MAIESESHNGRIRSPSPSNWVSDFVKAIFGDERRLADIPLAAHVPLAEVAGGVAGLLERAGQGRGFRIQPMGHAPAVVFAARGQVRR